MTELVIPDAGADTEINSDLLYMRVARLVFNQPLLVTPDVAETIGTFIRSRMDGARPESNRFVGRPVIDAHSGRWMGYRLPGSDYLFTEVPDHKVQELNAAVDFFGHGTDGQQIPDTIGTHAVFSSDGFHTIRLVEVVSWQLTTRGEVHALIADETEITRTPVLPGDPCLSDAQTHADFCYFFQHGIANRIKDQDPEALAAIATLAE